MKNEIEELKKYLQQIYAPVSKAELAEFITIEQLRQNFNDAGFCPTVYTIRQTMEELGFESKPVANEIVYLTKPATHVK